MKNKKLISIIVIFLTCVVLVSSYEKDTEDSYYCESGIINCINSVDENWTTYAYADNSVGVDGASIYENITIPEIELTKSINMYWFYYIIYGSPSIYCWDYSLLEFQDLDITRGTNISILIPENCYLNNLVQIKTTINYDLGNPPSTSRYYEGKVVLVVGYNSDDYTDIQSTLRNDYTADSYQNIDSTFGSDEIIDTCTCSGNENCIINCADNCDFEIVNMNRYNVLITDVDDGIVGKVINMGNLKNATRIRIEGGCNGSK